MSKWLLAGGFGLTLVIVSVIALGREGPSEHDFWVHPRGEAFDPELHYKAETGEIFYKAENDIERAIGGVIVDHSQRPRITVDLGADLFSVATHNKGSLRPVLLYDSSGDGVVDHSLRGRIEGAQAVFDDPQLSEIDHGRTYWQIGIRYVAGNEGDAKLDGRYLASVDSRSAQVQYRGIEELAHVGTGPAGGGLVILKHRADAPFDFAEFTESPSRFIDDFDQLTRADDADGWTAGGDVGRLITHLDSEDFFIVRIEGELALDLEWGDIPLASFLEDYLQVHPNSNGCYNTLHTGMLNPDESPVVIPHRILYCPEYSVAAFDVPDGYQIGLSALREGEIFERAEMGTSAGDNIRLYAREIYPRSPARRSTGTVTGNVRAGFIDAGADFKDMLRHAITGKRVRNIHTGQVSYRPSPVSAVPRALLSLARLEPGGVLPELLSGAASAVRAGADAVSAAGNAVVNPVMQVTVGNVASVNAADMAGHWLGVFSQAVAKNLPFGERSIKAFSPVAAWRHNRAFVPTDHTRTDTQLNIDRVMTVTNLVVISAIRNHNSDSSSGSNRGENSDGDGGDSANFSNPGDSPSPGAAPPAPPGAGGSPPAPPLSTPPPAASAPPTLSPPPPGGGTPPPPTFELPRRFRRAFRFKRRLRFRFGGC